MDNKDIRLLRQMEDSAVSLPQMTKKSEYTKQQIHYRLTEKLSEYVQKDSETENPGAARSTTLWNLSTAGEEKLESDSINEDKIETFNGLAEAAEEARRDSESAKSSVQQYRKKVSRIEGRLNSLKESIGETWSGMEDVDLLTRDDKEELKADYTELEADLKSLEKSLDSVETDVEELETEHIDYLEGAVENLEDKLAQIRRRNNELKRENRKLKTELDTQGGRISQLEDRISELEDKHESKSIIEQLADLI